MNSERDGKQVARDGKSLPGGPQVFHHPWLYTETCCALEERVMQEYKGGKGVFGATNCRDR